MFQEVILDPTVTEYRLTRLQPASRYVVLVQGERDGLYTSVVTSEFVTGNTVMCSCPGFHWVWNPQPRGDQNILILPWPR